MAHGGVSKARNFGLKKSLGKFITFIDSDDYIEENYFSSFKKIIDNNDIDIYLCGINIVKEDEVLKKNANINGKFEKKELFNKYKDNVFNSGVFCLVANKIYKSEILKKIISNSTKIFQSVKI